MSIKQKILEYLADQYTPELAGNIFANISFPSGDFTKKSIFQFESVKHVIRDMVNRGELWKIYDKSIKEFVYYNASLFELTVMRKY